MCDILSADKEYDAYLSYTKVDLDSLGRSVTGFWTPHAFIAHLIVLC